MAEDSGQTVVAALLDSILPLRPTLIEPLEVGIEMLDVGCGSGRALNLMACSFPNSGFVDYDLSEEGIARGRAEAEENGTTNIRFEVRDVSTLEERVRYELVTTFGAVHDQARLEVVPKGIADGLRPDIAASSHVHNNLDHPVGPFLYAISCMQCRRWKCCEKRGSPGWKSNNCPTTSRTATSWLPMVSVRAGT